MTVKELAAKLTSIAEKHPDDQVFISARLIISERMVADRDLEIGDVEEFSNLDHGWVVLKVRG